jgi:hypothetical protein
VQFNEQSYSNRVHSWPTPRSIRVESPITAVCAPKRLRENVYLIMKVLKVYHGNWDGLRVIIPERIMPTSGTIKSDYATDYDKNRRIFKLLVDLFHSGPNPVIEPHFSATREKRIQFSVSLDSELGTVLSWFTSARFT